MVNDTSVTIDIEEEYSAGQETPRNREEIYSAMIIYGLLSYHDGELWIPNKELMLEFQKALKEDDFGSVAELVLILNFYLKVLFLNNNKVPPNYV